MQKGATAVDPLIDLVRQRTDELQRVADSVRRGRAATSVSPEAATVAVAPAATSASVAVAPAGSAQRVASAATCQLVSETSARAPIGAGAKTHRAA